MKTDITPEAVRELLAARDRADAAHRNYMDTHHPGAPSNAAAMSADDTAYDLARARERAHRAVTDLDLVPAYLELDGEIARLRAVLGKAETVATEMAARLARLADEGFDGREDCFGDGQYDMLNECVFQIKQALATVQAPDRLSKTQNGGTRHAHNPTPN